MRIKFKKLLALLVSAAIINAVPAAAIELAPDGKISRQQMQAQIRFFNNALQEFGAVTPEQAVKLWIKGDETRNGVYKYAVASDRLKQQLTERWGNPEKSFWIIGGSSPWLSKSEILNQSKKSDTEVIYKVKYYWSTSAGPAEPSIERLSVKKQKEKWCIDEVVSVSGPRYY